MAHYPNQQRPEYQQLAHNQQRQDNTPLVQLAVDNLRANQSNHMQRAPFPIYNDQYRPEFHQPPHEALHQYRPEFHQPPHEALHHYRPEIHQPPHEVPCPEIHQPPHAVLHHYRPEIHQPPHEVLHRPGSIQNVSCIPHPISNRTSFTPHTPFFSHPPYSALNQYSQGHLNTLPAFNSQNQTCYSLNVKNYDSVGLLCPSSDILYSNQSRLSHSSFNMPNHLHTTNQRASFFNFSQRPQIFEMPSASDVQCVHYNLTRSPGQSLPRQMIPENIQRYQPILRNISVTQSSNQLNQSPNPPRPSIDNEVSNIDSESGQANVHTHNHNERCKRTASQLQHENIRKRRKYVGPKSTLKWKMSIELLNAWRLCDPEFNDYQSQFWRTIQNIKTATRCPTCNILFDAEETTIEEAIIIHALTTHNNEFNLIQRELFIVPLIQNPNYCKICNVEYNQSVEHLQRNMHIRLHQDTIPVIDKDSRRNFQDIVKDNLTKPSYFFAICLENLLYNHRLIHAQVVVLLYIPFKVKTLADFFMRVRNANLSTRIRIPFYISNYPASTYVTNELFQNSETFTILCANIFNPLDERNGHLETFCRSANFCRYIYFFGKLHCSNYMDIIPHVELYPIGMTEHEKRLKPKLGGITEHDIRSTFEKIFDDNLTIFCKTEWENKVCDNATCNALIHTGNTTLYYERLVKNRHPSIMEKSRLRFEWGSLFFNDKAPRKEKSEEYVKDMMVDVNKAKGKIRNLYLIAVSNENSPIPLPSLASVNIGGKVFSKAYKLYVGNTSFDCVGKLHFAKTLLNRSMFAKALRTQFSHYHIIFTKEMSIEKTALCEAIIQLGGLLYEYFENGEKGKIDIINRQVEWTSLRFIEYFDAVNFFDIVIQGEGFIYENPPDHRVGVINLLGQNIFISDSQLAETYYPDPIDDSDNENLLEDENETDCTED